MTDVLIVGAGPVGLFLATECARRGISYRIVETHVTQSTHSKALAVFPRTFEVLDMAGLADRFLKAANQVTGVAIVSHQRTIGRIDFTPKETPYSFVAMVPQDVTERLLAERLHEMGGAVEYETTLTSAKETADGVAASVERLGAPQTIEAKFVVGCDGAHSTVRQLLGLQFEGAGYSEHYMLADVMTNDALPADEMQLCPSQFGPLAIFPISARRRRIVGTIDDVSGDAPSLEMVNAVLAQRAPEGIVAESMLWSSYFKIHHRMVAHMSVGRIFVAGDAAHIHSPFGGQGMNTGLQDAWNLAWKLDLAVRGLATPELLESYSQERHPVVRGVIETTHFLTNGMGARNPVARNIRDTVIPIVTHIPQLQHAFVDRLSGLGIAYKDSPIVDGAGRRYFDDTLRGGTGICNRFLLLAPAAEAASANAVGAHFKEAVEVRSNGANELLLLRPDGYLAFEAPQANATAFQTVEAVLRKQVR